MMERWVGTVAVVTGASVGIGPVICRTLAEKGLKVVGFARRVNVLQELSAELRSSTQGQIIGVRCDVASEDAILRAFQWTTENVGPVQVLVNCATISRNASLTDGATREWQRIFDINVMALCICTREAIKIMKRYNIAGHVIHMNSVAGHQVPDIPGSNFNVYPASKFAVTALTETLRQELKYQGSRIKVTSISPGMVRAIYQEGFPDDDVKEIMAGIPVLRPEDVAQAVVYVLSTGPNVEVHELILKPLGEQF